MTRDRPNRKAPDIDILARHYVSRGLSNHPDITKHVERVKDVEEMGMWALLTLAKRMRVNADAIIRKTEQEERALSDYSFRYPAFKGELDFDLTFSFLGQSIVRKAKIVYEHTPEWEYWDPRKRALFTGWPGSRYHVELAAVPEVHESDDTVRNAPPEWFQMEDITRDGVLPHEAWDALLDAVDEKCKTEDAARRISAIPAAGKA